MVLATTILNGSLTVIRLAIRTGREINALSKVRHAGNERYTPLINSMRRENFSEEIVRLLLERGADVNGRSQPTLTTPLMWAVSEERPNEIIEQLIRHGADVNAQDVNGKTPLLYTTYYNMSRVGLLLLNHGADVNIADNEGKTPLMQAVKFNNLPYTRLLVERGANVLARKEDGRTVLMEASWWSSPQEVGDTDMIKFLLDNGAGAVINAQERNGDTALIFAVWSKRPDIIQLLRNRGADTTLKNKFGQTALDIASSQGYWAIYELLQPPVIPIIPIIKHKKRQTSKWMELCNTLGENAGLTELRNIVIEHTKRTNFDRMKTYFGYGGSLADFRLYVNTLRKRKICAGLAKYYTDIAEFEDVTRDCENEDTISGDKSSKVPPERFITLNDNGRNYCFDILEVGRLN
jgi:ankyrin repeat protein